MRPSLKLAAATAVTAATIFGGSAWASGTHAGGAPLAPQNCGAGTVSATGSSVLWPPNHKSKPYTVTYDDGAAGDVLTTSATSSDGNGVSPADPQSSTVADGETSASTTTGLRAERPGNSTGRTYTLSYSVTGSNTCEGSFTVTAPHDRRRVK